jgi:hypothetical protein
MFVFISSNLFERFTKSVCNTLNRIEMKKEDANDIK